MIYARGTPENAKGTSIVDDEVVEKWLNLQSHETMTDLKKSITDNNVVRPKAEDSNGHVTQGRKMLNLSQLEILHIFKYL